MAVWFGVDISPNKDDGKYYYERESAKTMPSARFFEIIPLSEAKQYITAHLNRKIIFLIIIYFKTELKTLGAA
jgi:hypothetical protein